MAEFQDFETRDLKANDRALAIRSLPTPRARHKDQRAIADPKTDISEFVGDQLVGGPIGGDIIDSLFGRFSGLIGESVKGAFQQTVDLFTGLASIPVDPIGGVGQVVGALARPFEIAAQAGQQAPPTGLGQEGAGTFTPIPGGQAMPNGIQHAAGQPFTSLQVGAQAPAMGTITKVWDTWPGRGVTGGGRAPIFFRTIEGKTFVRKIDGTIKKVPKSRNLVLNTRKLNLSTYVKMEKALDRISRRIAKGSRSLKRS